MNNQICPYCGRELEQGTFHSRGGNYFLPNGEKTPSFYTEKAMEKRKAILLPPDPFQWKDRNIPTPTYAGPAKKSSSPMSTPISKALRLHFRNCSAVILGFPFRGSCQPQAD